MTFTIDNENNITAHGTPEEAAAATATPFDTFASEQELAELAAAWPAERLVAIWNSLPGVTPVKRFKTSQRRGQPHLGAHPGPRRGRHARGEVREAEGGTEAQAWATGGQGRARQGQGDQEGHPCQERAQG